MHSASRNLISVLQHAARVHGSVPIVSADTTTGELHRYGYRDAYLRTNQAAHALRRLVGESATPVATLASNTHRHFESWYAISGQGLICHTVNPRLSDDQLVFILNHAEDRVLLTDSAMLPTVARIRQHLRHLKKVIVFDSGLGASSDGLASSSADLEELDLDSIECLDYETLLAQESGEFDWPTLPVDTPAGLCYTSGTTGDPKGVLYTHGTNLRHAGAVNEGTAMGLSAVDCVLMVVPMFHANSWGLAFSCPMAGCKLVLPGPQLDGPNLLRLLLEEAVTFAAAVPTIWSRVLQSLEKTEAELPWLREVIIGGSAVPRTMVESFEQRYAVNVLHAWGMTELSPMGTMCRVKHELRSLDSESQMRIRLKQGLPSYGLELRIVDSENKPLPHDGTSVGHIQVRGDWVLRRYFKEDKDCVDHEGWFDSGDVGTVDKHGYLAITDRAKDLVKSGGEWISSVQLENAAMGIDGVESAAVIAVDDAEWGERPLLLVVARERRVSPDEIREVLAAQFPRWWLPDRIEYVDELPLTGTGKVNKRIAA